jgi:hypothetical protein
MEDFKSEADCGFCVGENAMTFYHGSSVGGVFTKPRRLDCFDVIHRLKPPVVRFFLCVLQLTLLFKLLLLRLFLTE